ncbi:hypothetical protein [Chamaesiphon sp. OTE_20_metabat_361]|uniref:hypothetical protein n=1 Tax=Chamaesiphon sp. OTE_20_metabat_361 TaxID=2964689 RepID=UPI00286ADADA|nr:hypothetical protein [Chamaesiphon sp. OTE_20_metabat_361]
MSLVIGKKGLITNGDMQGWYLRIDDDYQNTGGFLIIYNSSSNLLSGVGYDDWVENKAALQDFFEESCWTIDWNED